MVVPNLGVDEQLDEPDSPFDQPAGNQTTPAIRLCGFIINAVQFQCGGRFLCQVQRISGAKLHASGQLIRRDTCVQLRSSGPFSLVDAIQSSDQFAFDARHALGRVELGRQIQNRLPLRSKSRPLINGRQIARLPVIDAVDGQAQRIV